MVLLSHHTSWICSAFAASADNQFSSAFNPKLKNVFEYAVEQKCKYIVINNDISPSQIKNIHLTNPFHNKLCMGLKHMANKMVLRMVHMKA